MFRRLDRKDNVIVVYVMNDSNTIKSQGEQIFFPVTVVSHKTAKLNNKQVLDNNPKITPTDLKLAKTKKFQQLYQLFVQKFSLLQQPSRLINIVLDSEVK